MTIEILRKEIQVARISRAMHIQRSSIYYRRTEGTGKRNSRISENMEAEIIRLSADRTTYGYRRIWALLRNSSIHVNIKIVRKIMRRNDLALPSEKHKNRTGRSDLTRPDNINILWETDIDYMNTDRDGIVYPMSIKDSFNKKWISYEFSKACTAKDCIKAVKNAYMIRFLDGNYHDVLIRTDNGPRYVSGAFKKTVKILGIRSEYI